MLVPLGWALVVVSVSLAAVRYWSDDLVEHTLLAHAESSAITWRQEFTRNAPDLAGLVEGRVPSIAQRDYVDASLSGSDIQTSLFNGYL